MVVVKIRFRPLRRPEMDKNRPNAPGLDLAADPGNVVQSLAAKGASKMAEKDQQDRRFIQELKQGSTALGAVLLQNRSHLCLFRFRQTHTSHHACQRQGGVTV